jgi:hypothetical protein
MSRRLRDALPQRWRLKLWLARNWLTRESFELRRARPSWWRRVAAHTVLAQRARRLTSEGGAVGIDRLDAVTVINLASRTDRLKQFMGEMRRLGVDRVERFDALLAEPGIIGCTRSHLECVRRITRDGLEAAMVCEDDAIFLVDRPQLDVLVDAFLDDPAADVACLGYFASRSEPHDSLFLRGKHVRTMSCYVVKARVAEELGELLELGVRELERGGDRRIYGCDKIWMRLQDRRVFLIPIVRAVRQSAGYSDVERRVVVYDH